MTPRLRPAPAPAPVTEMGSRATVPSTVNLRIPAEHRSVPAEESRDPVVPPQGLQPQLVRAPFQEEDVSIKDQDPNRPSQAEDPSKPSAKGKEKLDLGKTPRAGEPVQSLHEQALDKGKNVTQGECSKPAASPASSGELPDDHPMKQEAGSLLHTAFLVVLAHEKMLIEQLVDYLEMHSPKKKFPDNWLDELENQLMSNRHFRQREGMFSVCGDCSQPPSNTIVNKKMEPSVVIGCRDKNLAEHSRAGKSTESEVQERPPPLTLAVRTPRLPKPSDEDSDWIPSMEKLERAAPRGGRRGPYQKRQRAAASESEERSSSAIVLSVAAKECAETDGVWGCTSKALQGELHCERHKRRSSAPKECAMMDGTWRCTLNALQDELFCAQHSEKTMQKLQKLQK